MMKEIQIFNQVAIPRTLTEMIKFLTEDIQKVPPEFEDICLLHFEEGYMSCSYFRPETDKEMEIRIAAQLYRKSIMEDKQEIRDRQTYDRLKAKFEDKKTND